MDFDRLRVKQKVIQQRKRPQHKRHDETVSIAFPPVLRGRDQRQDGDGAKQQRERDHHPQLGMSGWGRLCVACILVRWFRLFVAGVLALFVSRAVVVLFFMVCGVGVVFGVRVVLGGVRDLFGSRLRPTQAGQRRGEICSQYNSRDYKQRLTRTGCGV